MPEESPETRTDNRKPDLSDIYQMNRAIKEDWYTPGQREVLEHAGKFLLDSPYGKVCTFAGYAGTGKTTLIENIAKFAQALNYDVAILTPTHKAKQVISANLALPGGVVRNTIHSALYGAPDERTGAFSIGHPKALHDSGKVVIFDESSMIGGAIHNDILSAMGGTLPIFFGDPFQLPPVKDAYSLLDNPDVTLTKVLRHGSNILGIATAVRTQKRIIVPNVDYDDVRIYRGSDAVQFCKDRERDAVIICMTNKRRVLTNHIVRKTWKMDGVLAPGDRMVCISNNDIYVNGETFEVEEIVAGPSDPIGVILNEHAPTRQDFYFRYLIKDKNGKEFKVFVFPDNLVSSIYNAQIPELVWYEDDGKHIDNSVVIATYGYALSCHKSQGSQWDTVYVDQDFVTPENAARWYYTAVTRARKELWINVVPYGR